MTTRLTIAKWTLPLLLVPLFLAVAMLRPHLASAAACTAPSTDYGTVSGLSANISSAGTYRIWTRMAAPNSTNNTYLLEVDGSSCYTVGGSSVPTYASGATTYFASGSTNWISKTSSGTQVDLSLTAGTHSFKLIGNAPNVVVDRLVMTQDTTCTPTGTGDNCANPPDTTSPTVSITSPANKAVISTTTTVTANATDDVAVSKVEFYIDGQLQGTDTTATGGSNYSYSLNPTTLGLSSGAHTLTAKAYDTSNNSATSTVVNITYTPSGGGGGGGGTTYLPEDINEDGVVDIRDFGILASNFGKSGAAISNPRADINGDGVVDIRDFGLLASKFGS